jgi:Asp-tRNA(Asn)/Glu-tRNA(Gln) amidotransferase C subunit
LKLTQGQNKICPFLLGEKMINIEKLEKLSCLKLDENTKVKIVTSIEGVAEMISVLENTSLEHLEFIHNNVSKQKLEENYEFDTLIKRENKNDGVNLEERFFLAPKVIKK